MDNKEDNELKDIMDALAKGATHIVASPETIKRLKGKGLPIESRFIPYEQYVEDLYTKRKNDAVQRLRKLPAIQDSIANGVVSDIYEEIRVSYAFGIYTSTILNSILLLEYAMRSRLYAEYLKSDPNTEWFNLEKLAMDALVQRLYKLKVIDAYSRDILASFSKDFRNPYFHINVQKMTEGIIIEKLPGFNESTRETINLENVEASKHRFLWFAAKKYFDKYFVQTVIDFCIEWTNTLLKK